MTGYAYTTSDPKTVDAYRAAYFAREDANERLLLGKAMLGCDAAYGIAGTTGQPHRITAFSLPRNGQVPAGWELAGDARIRPQKGKTGAAARAWLADHHPGDLRYVMEQHGLPRNVWLPGRGDRLIVEPELVIYDNALWALYPIEPGVEPDFHSTKCTWTPCTVDEFSVAASPDDSAVILRDRAAPQASTDTEAIR
jgi:hypothetical protein